jgi:hypothetical protein
LKSIRLVPLQPLVAEGLGINRVLYVDTRPLLSPDDNGIKSCFAFPLGGPREATM